MSKQLYGVYDRFENSFHYEEVFTSFQEAVELIKEAWKEEVVANNGISIIWTGNILDSHDLVKEEWKELYK